MWAMWGFFSIENIEWDVVYIRLAPFILNNDIILTNNIIHDFTILTISLKSIYCENPWGELNFKEWGDGKIFL